MIYLTPTQSVEGMKNFRKFISQEQHMISTQIPNTYFYKKNTKVHFYAVQQYSDYESFSRKPQKQANFE